MIIALLLVAIYFIVADAINRKSEACLYRHFSTSGLLQKYNVTLDHDYAKSTYSDQDCQSFVDTSRKRTLEKIDTKNTTECIKTEFKGPHIESLMLEGVAAKFGWHSEPMGISKIVFYKSSLACAATANSTSNP